MNNCPKCGFILSPGETVCSNCGEPVQNVNATGIISEATVDPAIPAMPEIPIIKVVPEDLNTPVQTNESGMQGMPEVPISPVEPSMQGMSEVPISTAEPSMQGMPEVPISPVEPSMQGMPEVPISPVEPSMQGMPEVPISPVEPSMQGMPEVPISPVEPSMQGMPEAPISSINSNISSKESIPFSEKFNRITFIAVLVISLIAIAILSFFIIKMFAQEEQVPVRNTLEQAKEYHFEGFDFYIPDDIYVEIYNGEFYVGSRESNWSAVMTLQTGNYNTLVSNKSQLLDHFRKTGYEATEPEEKEISGTAFVVTEVMMGTKNVLVAYAKANGTKVFGIVLENESGKYSDEDLKPIGTILAATKYVGPTYELPEGFQINLFKESFTIAQ